MPLIATAYNMRPILPIFSIKSFFSNLARGFSSTNKTTFPFWNKVGQISTCYFASQFFITVYVTIFEIHHRYFSCRYEYGKCLTVGHR
jgi:hypothetical protein